MRYMTKFLRRKHPHPYEEHRCVSRLLPLKRLLFQKLELFALGVHLSIMLILTLGLASRGSAESYPLSPNVQKQILERANRALNQMTTMRTDFVQINPDQSTVYGKFFFSRPGKLRFSYQNAPALVIADGQSLAIINPVAKTQSLYFIHQTPLSFLLSKNINLFDYEIQNVIKSGNELLITLVDHSLTIGTNRITLRFDSSLSGLKGWIVTDGMNRQTRVSLSKVQRGLKLSPFLFFINYGRESDDKVTQYIARHPETLQ